jgi:hypothetical protein
MTYRTAALVAALLISLPVFGCYESVGVTWYEAGEYKGPRDPLLNKLKTDELQRQLADRFRDVQTDR